MTPRLAVALLLLTLQLPLLSTPEQCVDTWFKSGDSDKLVLKWNSPLPVAAIGDLQMPAPGPEADSPPQVTLSQTQILDSFTGTIDVTISGLEEHQRVILEKYRLTTAADGVTEDAILQGSFTLQDGYFPEVGEVYNFNIPGDENDVSKVIQTSLDLYEPDISTTVGDYVYRVRSPNDSYPPVDTPFRIDPEIATQAFSGTVQDPQGNPIPGAYVAVLNPLGLDNTFVYGETTDEDGDYLLFTAADEEYDLVAAAPGFVGPYGKNVSHFIEENEYPVVDITLTPATRTIRGRLHDAHDPDIALAGVELVMLSVSADGEIDQNYFTVTWTDANGGFEVEVIAGHWIGVVRHSVVFNRGYLGTGRDIASFPIADTTLGDIDAFDLGLTRGHSVIHGRLTSSELDSDGHEVPLVGVAISAIRDGDGAASHGVTDGDGDYRIAVPEGYWNVFATPHALQEEDHSAPFPSDIKVGAEPSSIEYNFTARPIAAYVTGFLTEEDGDPISKLMLRGVNLDRESSELAFRNTDDTDGFFSFGLGSGDWVLLPDPSESAKRQLLFSGLPAIRVPPLLKGQEPPELDADFSTVSPTGEVVITVVDETGQPLQGIRGHGSAHIQGIHYHSFGISDVAGEMRLMCVDGTWRLHLSDIDLRDQGFLELPAFEVTTSGTPTELVVTVDSFKGIDPEIVLDQSLVDDLFWQGTAEPGRRYTVEGSTDLKNWRELGRVIAEGGTFCLTPDENTSAMERIFLQLRWPVDSP